MGKFILIVVLIAVIVYVVVRLIDTRGAILRRGRGGSGGQPEPRPRGPLGPDDDPDFLRDLNRRRPRKGDPEG